MAAAAAAAAAATGIGRREKKGLRPLAKLDGSAPPSRQPVARASGPRARTSCVCRRRAASVNDGAAVAFAARVFPIRSCLGLRPRRRQQRRSAVASSPPRDYFDAGKTLENNNVVFNRRARRRRGRSHNSTRGRRGIGLADS